MSDAKPPFLRRVVIDNYKSIKHCDVTLGPLTFLLGPNGSGKSNFLDALAFLADSLRDSVASAIHERGGLLRVCHASRTRPEGFSICTHVALPSGATAVFRFVVGVDGEFRSSVQEEECWISAADGSKQGYRVQSEQLESATFGPAPPPSTYHLYLRSATAYAEFRSVHQLLDSMRFYRIDPKSVLKGTNYPVDILGESGQDTSELLRRIHEWNPTTAERVGSYMASILPYLKAMLPPMYQWTWSGGSYTNYTYRRTGSQEDLSVRLKVGGEGSEVWFPPDAMSDGTLRALGVLTALFQCKDRPPDRRIPLVGIEEPEATIHPAAAGVLTDALREASHFTQVIVTSHSPDLLDVKDLDPDSILVVDAPEGETIIGPMDDASRSILRDRLCTAGELLRQNQLSPQIGPSEPAESNVAEKGGPDLPGNS